MFPLLAIKYSLLLRTPPLLFTAEIFPRFMLQQQKQNIHLIRRNSQNKTDFNNS